MLLEATDVEFKSVLFLCVANSARSQMAEALARQIFGDGIQVQSAGSKPSTVNPFAIAAMQERGISMDSHRSKDVDSIEPGSVDLIITLCAEEVCPSQFGETRRLHWPLTDPDRRHEDLSEEERLQHFRSTRDELSRRLELIKAEREAGSITSSASR